LDDRSSGDTAVQSQSRRGSIYDINMTFENQDAQWVAWQSLKGKAQVMAMIFTHCQASCPMITHEIKDAENLVPASLKNRVGYTLISFDTKRDTAARLKSHYDTMHLDPSWQLLHGSAEDIQTIASLLDVKFKKMASGDFSHSNVIIVVDASGHIVWRREGIERNPGEIASKIESLF